MLDSGRQPFIEFVTWNSVAFFSSGSVPLIFSTKIRLSLGSNRYLIGVRAIPRLAPRRSGRQSQMAFWLTSLGVDDAMVGTMSSHRKRQDRTVRNLKRLLTAEEVRVSVAMPHLADAFDQVEHAQDYLCRVIEKEMTRLSLTSWDEANEKSGILSNLMFVYYVLDDARFPLQEYVDRGLRRLG